MSNPQKKFNEMTVEEKYNWLENAGMDITPYPDIVKYKKSLGYASTLQAIDKIDLSPVKNKEFVEEAHAWLKRDFELSNDTNSDRLTGRIQDAIAELPEMTLDTTIIVAGITYTVLVKKEVKRPKLTSEQKIAKVKLELLKLEHPEKFVKDASGNLILKTDVK
jgi:hypothetical protein